ncbi:MAG TPA: sodium-dependent transporter [Parachlamydiaceae bacterium]|nr:sodium-dependent transporter [Parachlamydiaceae bacterium]
MDTSQNNGNKNWKSQAGFVWALIGSAVGFANILSFSAQVYKNGGGAFLIPYCMALFMLGIPLLILEGLIGSRTQSPLVTAYGSVWGKTGKTLGWLAVMACLTIGGFYIVLTGYSVAYTYFFATNAIPEDSKVFFIETFLNKTQSITEFGELSIPIFAATTVVALATWLVLVRNVKDGIERVCSIFMPILAVIMTLFAVVASLLPGGAEGWFYYLKPDFSRLMDPTLWRDVFGQLFFSLSLGLGIVVGYSRYSGQVSNIPRAMMFVAMGDFAVSFLSGAAIFGCLAHISHVQQIPFESILKSDSTFEIGFIVFPTILKFFGPVLGQVMGVVFFFCIFIAGITGVFSITESIAGNVENEFKITRKRAVTITIAAMMCLAALFCMGNASHLIDALAPMVMGTCMLIGGLASIIAFYHISPEVGGDAVWKGKRGLSFYGFCISYIAPVILGIILIGNLATELCGFTLEVAVRWIWFAAVLFIAWNLARSSGKSVKV